MIGLYFLIGFLFGLSYVEQRPDKYSNRNPMDSVVTLTIVTTAWPIFVIIKLSSP